MIKIQKQSSRALANSITSKLSAAEDRYNQQNRDGKTEMERKIRALWWKWIHTDTIALEERIEDRLHFLQSCSRERVWPASSSGKQEWTSFWGRAKSPDWKEKNLYFFQFKEFCGRAIIHNTANQEHCCSVDESSASWQTNIHILVISSICKWWNTTAFYCIILTECKQQ